MMNNTRFYTRRQWLHRSLQLALGTSQASAFGPLLLASLGRTAHADIFASLDSPWSMESGPFFVLIRATGGLDCVLGLDPQILPPDATEKDLFIGYRPEEIATNGNIRLGPAATPLLKHAESLAVINGVYMGSPANHEIMNSYASSGAMDGNAQSLAVELDATQKHPMPKGVIHADAGIQTGSRKSAVISDVRNMSELNESPFKDLLEKNADNKNQPSSALEIAKQGASISNRKLADTIRKLNERRFESETEKTNTLITQAFLLGLSKSSQISLNIGLSLDTHTDHLRQHLPGQRSGVWEPVSKLFDLFKSIPLDEAQGISLFDRTLFMVCNEFSRTPYLNDSSGKDHNGDTNSFLLAGYGIRGGNTFGASTLDTRASKRYREGADARHRAQYMNFKTGELRAPETAGFELLRPEHITRSVAKIFDDPADFSSVDLNRVPVIPGLIKET
ncbi:MAG: DUF1501 domain-containing protein [Polyangiaceae bacterium]|nr:DUF1501 domain-containing protein [Polyangiaceae bacterium]